MAHNVRMTTALQVLFCATCFAFGACASRNAEKPAHRASATKQPRSGKPRSGDSDTPFGNHPSASVRNAANFGGGLIGVLVGIPASVALVPVTYPLASITKDKWTGLYPFGACYFVGGALFGGAVVPFASLGDLATRRGE